MIFDNGINLFPLVSISYGIHHTRFIFRECVGVSIWMVAIDPLPIIVLGIILGLTAYALWMFLKKVGAIYLWAKKGELMHKKEDEAYNQLNLLRGLMKAMRAKGRDVSKAAAMVRVAAEAFEDGDYNKVLEMADDIKHALLTSPESFPGGSAGATEEKKDILTEPAVTPASNDEKETPMMVLKREKPPNYLESKFMLQKAETVLTEEEKKGNDVSRQRELLIQGRTAFENKDYTAALSYAIRVMREFDPSMFTPVETKDEGEKPEEKAQDVTPEKMKPPVTPEEKKCDSCGSICDPEDSFCYNCGSPLLRKCVCGRPIRNQDRFCRGCGKKV